MTNLNYFILLIIQKDNNLNAVEDLDLYNKPRGNFTANPSKKSKFNYN